MMQSIKTDLNKLNSYLPREIDLFICSVSFELRSVVALKNIDPEKVKKCIVCVNDTDDINYRKNYLNKKISLIKSKFRNTDLIKLKLNDPLTTADNIFLKLKKNLQNKNATIVFDITTFTHESLLIIIKILSILNQNNVRIVYNIAKEYSYNIKNVKDKWLSKGIREIRSVIGFSGKFKYLFKTHLIMLVGYESHRSRSIIEHYEPSIISLGVARKNASTQSEHYELNAIKHNKLHNIYGFINDFDFSCKDIVDAKNLMIKLENKYPDTNVILAPLNNKISTIGVGLAALENSNWQICYSSPVIYNVDAYSIPSENFIVQQLPSF